MLAGAHAAVLIVLLFPVWLVDMVPMPDFPGHLARIHVLASLDTDKALAEIYRAHWALYPNLTLDLFVLGAMHVMPIVTAGKFFISLATVLWMGGTAWLHYLLTGRLSSTPLIGSLFVLNAFFFFGFLNFTFGTGLVLTGLALWVALTHWPARWRIICFIPIAAAAYISHIMAFAILGCCVIGYELGLSFSDARFSVKATLRRLLISALPLAPVVMLYIFVTPHETHGSQIAFGSLQSIVFRPVHASHLVLGEPYKAALLFVAIIFGLGLLTRTITIDRRMWPVLLGLGVAAFLCPTHLLTGAHVHIRLPAVIGCLAIASSEWAVGRVVRAVAGLTLAVLLGYRAFMMTDAWAGFDRTYAELETALDTIETGSKIFLARSPAKDRTERKAQPVYSHFLALMGVQRQIFTPRIFAWPGQHPLRRKEIYSDLGAKSAFQGGTPHAHSLITLAEGDPGGIVTHYPYLKFWQCKYDYVVIQGKAPANPAPAMLAEYSTGEHFTIYKIALEAAGCGASKGQPNSE